MKYFLGVLALVAIAGGIFYSFWMPLPDSPAREAVGQQKSIDHELNAGHAMLPEQPDQIAGAIIAFLQEQQ